MTVKEGAVKAPERCETRATYLYVGDPLKTLLTILHKKFNLETSSKTLITISISLLH